MINRCRSSDDNSLLMLTYGTNLNEMKGQMCGGNSILGTPTLTGCDQIGRYGNTPGGVSAESCSGSEVGDGLTYIFEGSCTGRESFGTG